MYEAVLLFYYCWRFMVLKNRLQFKSTKILHGYERQANLFVAIAVRTDLPKVLLPMRLRNRNIYMIYHFPTEFFYQNSYFWLRLKKHPSQRLRNMFKINLFSVYCKSVESAKAPVRNKLSRSECKPTHECLFHSFCHRWTCCSQKLVHSSRHFYKNCVTVWLPVTTTSCFDSYANFFFMKNRIHFLFRYLSNHRSMFTKLLEKMEWKN